MMSKLLVSLASPYSSKVRMAAAHAGYEAEIVQTDTSKPNAELSAANPLGKIPVLISDRDGAVFDSMVIVQYLNRETGGKLLPRAAGKRLEAERLEAIADGISDCAVAYVYEKRWRPETHVFQGWLDKQWGKVTAALDYLESTPPKVPAKIHAGHIALAASLGYLSLRFPGWDKSRPKLKRYVKKFAERHPELAEMLPRLA
jgi:glutathione S-transferase